MEQCLLQTGKINVGGIETPEENKRNLYSPQFSSSLLPSLVNIFKLCYIICCVKLWYIMDCVLLCCKFISQPGAQWMQRECGDKRKSICREREKNINKTGEPDSIISPALCPILP